MTHREEAQQARRAEAAKARLGTATALMFGTVFGIIVLGIVLYLVFR